MYEDLVTVTCEVVLAVSEGSLHGNPTNRYSTIVTLGIGVSGGLYLL